MYGSSAFADHPFSSPSWVYVAVGPTANRRRRLFIADNRMNVRQNTARTIEIGPILNEDSTPYITDDLDRTDFRVSKNGTSGSLNASATVAHVTGDLQGMFAVSLTASDVDTLGVLQVSPNSTGLAGPPANLNVVTQDAWDALHHASDGRVRANSNQIDGSTTAATRAKEFWGSIESGTAQSGGSTTITLESGESSTDDFYNGAVILLTGGTGASQYRQITDYNGTTKVATVDSAWGTNPDSSTTYQIMGRIV